MRTKRAGMRVGIPESEAKSVKTEKPAGKQAISGIAWRIMPKDAPKPLTIVAAQKAVDDWIARNGGYWPPLSNLARLVEEVGELSRELNHRHGHKPKKNNEPGQDLSLELADVLFVLIALANEQGIDLDDALRRTLAKYAARDATRWSSSEYEAQDDDDDGQNQNPPRRGP